MRVRTQDETGIYVFENAWVGLGTTSIPICCRVPGREDAVVLGRYESIARAKGVLLEMTLAYQKDTKVFYMPTK